MMLFPKKTRPYYIATPSYEYRSSGVRTLHLLCHALNEAGYPAFLVGTNEPFHVNHNLNTPVVTPFNQCIDPIVVYPDIIKGNPLGIRSVVRYLLAEKGKFGGDTEFPETDQVWCALPSYGENVMRIPVSDTGIFYKDNSPRSGACFYSMKYDRICGNTLLPITDGATRLEGTLEQLADILRRSAVCYVYELTSAMTEAALCGCPVVLVRTPFFNTIDPTCMMGDVKWDDGEIVKICPDYLPEYTEICHTWYGDLLNFIKLTQGMP